MAFIFFYETGSLLKWRREEKGLEKVKTVFTEWDD